MSLPWVKNLFYLGLNDSSFIRSGMSTVKGHKKNAACDPLSRLCGYKRTAHFEHQGKTVSNLVSGDLGHNQLQQW